MRFSYQETDAGCKDKCCLSEGAEQCQIILK